VFSISTQFNFADSSRNFRVVYFQKAEGISRNNICVILVIFAHNLRIRVALQSSRPEILTEMIDQ
jgi:hypothetical protein